MNAISGPTGSLTEPSVRDPRPTTLAGCAHTEETVIRVKGPAQTLFEYLDDQTRLGAHMAKPLHDDDRRRS